MSVVASVITARWTRWRCPHDERTGCGFAFDLPELELRLTGDDPACRPLTVGYADPKAAREFFDAVQAEHERLDHAELLAARTAEQDALVDRLFTGLGIPVPRRSTAPVAA